MLLYSDIARSSPCLFMVFTALPLCYQDSRCAQIIDPRPTKVSCDSHCLGGVWFEDDLFLVCSTTPEEGRLLGWQSFVAAGRMEIYTTVKRLASLTKAEICTRSSGGGIGFVTVFQFYVGEIPVLPTL